MDRPAAPRLDADFAPAPELRRWALATFVDEGAPLRNAAHEHLTGAGLAFLWARPEWRRRGRVVYATAELAQPGPGASGWKRDRQLAQLAEWFGDTDELDFVITVWAHAWGHELDDRAACALIEHELLHCALARDRFGVPQFTPSGRPKFAIRGHDVEAFVEEVRRYGAYSPELEAMRAALAAEPEVEAAEIAAACGACKLRAA